MERISPFSPRLNPVLSLQDPFPSTDEERSYFKAIRGFTEQESLVIGRGTLLKKHVCQLGAGDVTFVNGDSVAGIKPQISELCNLLKT